MGGVYVNPYAGTDQTQNLSVSLYCGDWNTDFSGNPTWNANVYVLNAANVPNFKYGTTTQTYNLSLVNNGGTYSVSAINSANSPDAYHRYLEEAWLDDQTFSATNLQKEEIAAALWTLFVNSSNVGTLVGDINTSGSDFVKAVYDYLQAANTAVTTKGYLAPNWYVAVPTGLSLSGSGYTDGGQAMQEFLIHGFSGDTVPEPSAIVLLGTLLGFFAIAKFRRKQLV